VPSYQPTAVPLPASTLDGMDGIRRRGAAHIWQGTLKGYRVTVSNAGGRRYCVMHPRDWT
jgi:hypothetical protein